MNFFKKKKKKNTTHERPDPTQLPSRLYFKHCQPIEFTQAPAGYCVRRDKLLFLKYYQPGFYTSKPGTFKRRNDTVP